MKCSCRSWLVFAATILAVHAGASRANAQETPSGSPPAQEAPVPIAQPGAPSGRVAPETPTPLPAVVVAPNAPEPPIQQRRAWGLGTALGGGFAGASLVTTAGGSTYLRPALMLPSFEARIFLRSGFSIDISAPILNSVITSAAYRGIAWITDVYFNFNVGQGSVRLLAGPGLGFAVIAGSVLAASVAGASLRVPGVIGLEILTPGRGFGFQILAQPWLEIALAGAATSTASASGSAVGGGAIFLLGFVGYVTHTQR